MRTRIAAAAVLLLLSQAAQADDKSGYVDVYYVPSADLDLELPGFGSASDDGDGFGFKGLIPRDSIAVTGEYQTVSYDNSGIDNNQLRLGIGFIGPTTSGLFLEYVDVELDDVSADGFGVHGRLAGERFYGQVGYVSVEDDFETTSGIEFLVGVTIGGEGAVGGFVDLRKSMLEGDESNAEYEFTDIRMGVRIKL